MSNYQSPAFSPNIPEQFPLETAQQHASELSQMVEPHIAAGVAAHFAHENMAENTPRGKEMAAWIGAVRASRYNAIYFVSRSEAPELMEACTPQPETINQVGEYLDTTGASNAIINFALHDFMKAIERDPNADISRAPHKVPSGAIQTVRPMTFLVDGAMLLDREPIDSLRANRALYDWHDLAHNIAATISNGYFGARFHDGLAELGDNYLDLRYRAQDEGGELHPFSDTLVFTHLSKALFDRFEKEIATDALTEADLDDIQARITRELVSYFEGGHPLYNAETGRMVSTERAVDPVELSILLHCKRYERRAAEYERLIFVRGSPDGQRGDPTKDPLHSLSRADRIKFIASLGYDPLYFEARNLKRHRAHDDALGIVAARQLLEYKARLQATAADSERTRLIGDIALLEKAQQFYMLEDISSLSEINLYKAAKGS